MVRIRCRSVIGFASLDHLLFPEEFHAITATFELFAGLDRNVKTGASAKPSFHLGHLGVVG